MKTRGTMDGTFLFLNYEASGNFLPSSRNER